VDRAFLRNPCADVWEASSAVGLAKVLTSRDEPSEGPSWRLQIAQASARVAL
jgi:hypothetical protein